MVPSFTTSTYILFTDYIPSTDPTEVISTSSSSLPHPDIRCMVHTVSLSLKLGTFSSSAPLFHPTNIPTQDPNSETSYILFNPPPPR